MTVEDVRRVNQMTVGMKLLHEYAAIQCGECRHHFSADLARYHRPECGETFACPNCDHERVGLLFYVQSEDLPLAQRRPAKVAA